jgi:hypothetical protein
MNSTTLCKSKVGEVSFVQVALLVRFANINSSRLVTKGARFVITFFCLGKRVTFTCGRVQNQTLKRRLGPVSYNLKQFKVPPIGFVLLLLLDDQYQYN